MEQLDRRDPAVGSTVYTISTFRGPLEQPRAPVDIVIRPVLPLGRPVLAWSPGLLSASTHELVAC
jgi:hypothetical protein